MPWAYAAYAAYGPSWPAHSGITASHSRRQVGIAILAAIASELKPFQMENLVVQILTKEVRKRWDSKCNTCIGTPCAVYFMWQTVFRVSSKGLMLCMSKAHHERSQKHQKPLPTSWGLHLSPSSLRFCRALVALVSEISEIKAPTADFDLPRKEDEHQNPWYHCSICCREPNCY